MLRPIHITLAMSAVREGAALIRAGQTEAGLRLIEHGERYLSEFLETPDVVRNAVARANAVLRSADWLEPAQ